MDLKRLITHFTYQIEAKPEGGFIAHASDPTLEPLEAPTRMELQQKIQQNISAALANEFPGLKLPIQSQQLKMTFHVAVATGIGWATLLWWYQGFCEPDGDAGAECSEPDVRRCARGRIVQY